MAASTRSRFLAPACLFAAFAAGAPATAAELPKTPACRSALQALDQEEARMAAEAAGDGHQGSGGARRQVRQVAELRLKPLRDGVARECLGGLTSGPPPSQHTWVVPPAVPTTPARPVGAQPAAGVPTAPVVPAPRLDPPLTITHCNAGTCQASDGSTLTRMGPTLVGPRGNCLMQGVFLRCP